MSLVLIFAFVCSTLLDSSFTYACDDGEKYFVKPLQFYAIFKLRRVMVRTQLIWFGSGYSFVFAIKPTLSFVWFIFIIRHFWFVSLDACLLFFLSSLSVGLLTIHFWLNAIIICWTQLAEDQSKIISLLFTPIWLVFCKLKLP
jgi:hypothetical protein